LIPGRPLEEILALGSIRKAMEKVSYLFSVFIGVVVLDITIDIIEG